MIPRENRGGSETDLPVLCAAGAVRIYPKEFTEESDDFPDKLHKEVVTVAYMCTYCLHIHIAYIAAMVIIGIDMPAESDILYICIAASRTHICISSAYNAGGRCGSNIFIRVTCQFGIMSLCDISAD